MNDFVQYFEILGHTFASKLLVVCRAINIHEFRESNDFLKSYLQVTLANEYHLFYGKAVIMPENYEQNKGVLG